MFFAENFHSLCEIFDGILPNTDNDSEVVFYPEAGAGECQAILFFKEHFAELNVVLDPFEVRDFYSYHLHNTSFGFDRREPLYFTQFFARKSR